MLANFFFIFGENALLETHDNHDDDELSLFIEENWNVDTTNKTNTGLSLLKQWSPTEWSVSLCFRYFPTELNNKSLIGRFSV